MQTHNQKIALSFEFPVVFTREVFHPENKVLAETMMRLREPGRPRAMVVIDSGVALAPETVSRWFAAQCFELAGAPLVLPGGEPLKNDFARVQQLLELMLDAHLDRHAYVLAIGGGALLDVVGFAAALVHRGLRLIRLPTTVLSQNDSGVGVKNGVNFRGGKNAIGTFAPPFAVLNDFEFLRTLPDREWVSGIAEAFKVAIIRDRLFFEWLCANAPRLAARDTAAMEELVVRCAQQHLAHIRTCGDPFEMGYARPLDFGHWSAHKLERISEFKILHGEAVGVGVLLDSGYAALKGWLSAAELEAIRSGLLQAGLPLWFEELADPRLFDGLREFQEHLGGQLCVTFPEGIGRRKEVHEVDLACMREALSAMRPLPA